MGRNSLPKTLRFEVLKRDSFKCQYCGAAAPDVLLEVDHIKPVAGGGTDDIWNLVTACKPCNAGKSYKLLDDNAAITKSKRQLDELQARREQLEMLLEWSEGLQTLQSDTLEAIADHWRKLSRTYVLNEYGLDAIRKLLRDFSVAEILTAMTTAANTYLELGPDGTYTKESVEACLAKIGGICTVNKRTGGNEQMKELYRIRGLIRKRLLDMGKFFNSQEALNMLEAAVSAGVPLRALWSASYEAHNYNAWYCQIDDLIEEARRQGEAGIA